MVSHMTLQSFDGFNAGGGGSLSPGPSRSADGNFRRRQGGYHTQRTETCLGLIDMAMLHRIVMVAGPGGSGKTSLGQLTAAMLREEGYTVYEFLASQVSPTNKFEDAWKEQFNVSWVDVCYSCAPLSTFSTNRTIEVVFVIVDEAHRLYDVDESGSEGFWGSAQLASRGEDPFEGGGQGRYRSGADREELVGQERSETRSVQYGSSGWPFERRIVFILLAGYVGRCLPVPFGDDQLVCLRCAFILSMFEEIGKCNADFQIGINVVVSLWYHCSIKKLHILPCIGLASSAGSGV